MNRVSTGAYSAPSHYLNQCWVIVKWPLRNKLQWNFNQNKNIFIRKMQLKTSVKCRPFCPGGGELSKNLRILQGRKRWQLLGSQLWKLFLKWYVFYISCKVENIGQVSLLISEVLGWKWPADGTLNSEDWSVFGTWCFGTWGLQKYREIHLNHVLNRNRFESCLYITSLIVGLHESCCNFSNERDARKNGILLHHHHHHHHQCFKLKFSLSRPKMFRKFASWYNLYNFYLPRVKFNWSSPIFGFQGQVGDH